MWVGSIQSVEGLDKTKRLAFPQVRQNFSCLPAFKQEHQFFSAFDSSRNTDSSWVKPADLHTGTTPSALLSAQLEDSPYIFWDLASLIKWANPLYLYLLYTYVSFPGGSAVKKLPAMQEMQVWSLGGEYSLATEMATQSSTLAWGIPCTEKGPSGHKS